MHTPEQQGLPPCDLFVSSMQPKKNPNQVLVACDVIFASVSRFVWVFTWIDCWRVVTSSWSCLDKATCSWSELHEGIDPPGAIMKLCSPCNLIFHLHTNKVHVCRISLRYFLQLYTQFCYCLIMSNDLCNWSWYCLILSSVDLLATLNSLASKFILKYLDRSHIAS